MRSILKPVGRLLAFMVAGVLALTILSGAPSSAATATSPDLKPAATSADAHVSARTLARVKCAWRKGRCFGAIAVNVKTGKAFIANDKKTKHAAVHKAIHKCRNHASPGGCRKAGWARAACLAVAYRINNNKLQEWASAGAYHITKAKKKAKRKVAGPGKEYIWAWLCTTRKA